MAQGTAEKKAEKSYLASAVDSLNPWASTRSSTPPQKDALPPGIPSNTGDHATSPYYGRSLASYPPDCPPLNVQWFHAVDVPKRKPKFMTPQNGGTTKPPQPKKFVAFSASDSRAIETAYQEKLQELERERNQIAESSRSGKRPRAISAESVRSDSTPKTTVPVNEDFLFDVIIEDRELTPAYWEGPVYEVRRGSWFYVDGSTLRPCEENLAAQLEEGYLKIKPWQYPSVSSRTASPKPAADGEKATADGEEGTSTASKRASLPAQFQPQTYRLFGSYMNSIVTYQDSTTAWLSSDSVLSRVTSTVYEKFSGGGYMAGMKIVRGYTEPKKARDEKRSSTPPGVRPSSKEPGDKQSVTPKQTPETGSGTGTPPESADSKRTPPDNLEATRNRLTRQLSNLIERGDDPEAEEEAIRKREEKEIAHEYNAKADDNQGRNIEHLVLVTHGIGQSLSKRMESINFVHDVNVLRKTMKSVYSASSDLKALNSELDEPGLGNCRVQVLPVMWRHHLDFPKRRAKRGERDLGEILSNEEDEYPSLEDITIEGVAFARSLISDLALDVLLYQSSYREQIAEIVLKESNRIYKVFKQRNPEFKGKVHIIAHSLGSAIMFDILCRQKEKVKTAEPPWNPLRILPPASHARVEETESKELAFDFEVEDLYCLGSPIGLFQMLKGRTIAARTTPDAPPTTESPLDADYLDDPLLNAPPHLYQRISPVTGLPFSVSSPKVKQLYNIFHPSDPISYRIEPLISPIMTTLKPQALPYTKKSLFGSVAPQGLTGIGAKVGQSVSGLWSSLSAGIASNLLNRSLGLSNDEVAKMSAQRPAQQSSSSGSTGMSIPIGVITAAPVPTTTTFPDVERSEKTAERMRQLANGNGAKEATLIDDELETLFSRFQKSRAELAAKGSKDKGSTSPGGSVSSHRNSLTLNREKWAEEERKAQRLRREEMKVRALNRNGRVDYCIQESVLDINPLNTIASHISYWSDEDVSHFILSQLLANRDRESKR